MSMPVRHLPLVQQWDCHACGNCCREYEVPVTDAERRRIEALGWKQDADIGDLPLFVRQGRWSKTYHLLRTDHGCVFLSKDNRCQLHERHGAEAKPLACRLFPFVLVPAGDHWRVSLRFGCPSVVANQGRPLTSHTGELEQLAAALGQHEKLQGQPLPTPLLQAGQPIAWSDLLLFVQALLDLLGNRSDRLERRWRKCLALASFCRQARFDRVSGERLTEFLAVVQGGLDAEVTADAEQVPAPGWVGRIFFRQMLAVLARRDRGDLRGPATESSWRRLLIGWRFARGSGAVPRVNALLPQTTFEQVEAATGPLPPGAEHILERYYLVKVQGLQFFGAGHFGMPFWDGLEALAMTVPTILWLARALAAWSREEAVALAIQIVDNHLGYNPTLVRRRYRSMVSTLAQHGELAHLIAWYSR